MASLLSLLQKGYLPRELPPSFSTRSFGTFALSHGHGWPSGKWTGCAQHNLARAGGLRRALRLPNPVTYFHLSKLVSSNWQILRQHTWNARLSASRPSLITAGGRAIVPRYAPSELPRLRSLRRRGSRYILRTDINQFYPTLYTHSVPWAIHGKSICKAALNAPGKGGHFIGNKLDKALRDLNDGQTHGVPIGPDISLLVAESLLAAADRDLLQRCPGLVHGFRYVDDYELAFHKLSDAEQVLTELQGILAEYELSLNPRKTKIEELPKPLEASWAAELSRFELRGPNHPTGQRNDLVTLFSRAFEIASERPEEPVLKYAIARVRNENVSAGGWRAFQNCVLGAARSDPSTLAASLGTLHQAAVTGGHTVSMAPLEEVFEGVIETHGRRQEGSEVAWALWGSVAWGITLSSDAGRTLGRMDDDVVALLALEAESRQLLPGGALDKAGWSTAVNQTDATTGEHWLLTYEAVRRGWLQSPALAADPTFSAMATAGVGFYDTAESRPQFPAAAGRIPGGSLPDHYA